MNMKLLNGFTSLSALLLTSFIVSLGGVGTAVAFQQNLPKDIHEQLSNALRTFSHVDESSLVFAEENPTPTSTLTPTGATGITGATGSSGATGATGIEPTITPIPTPTGIVHRDDTSDDLHDKDDDADENEIDDERIQHSTGATVQLPIVPGKAESRHKDDKGE
jgi:hypothetical protein